MKKIFIMAMLVMGLVSCSEENVIEEVIVEETENEPIDQETYGSANGKLNGVVIKSRGGIKSRGVKSLSILLEDATGIIDIRM